MKEKQEDIKIIERKFQKPRADIIYPQIIGLKDKKLQCKINSLIRERVFQLLKEEGYKEDCSKTFSIGYEIKLKGKKILSIRIEAYFYAQGAAHGMTIVKGMTFNLENGQLYNISDIFDPKSNYLDRLSKIVKKEIKEKDIPLIVDFKGMNEDQEFYLTEKALILFYQLYEYTPYAYGIPEFIVPYFSIQDMIKEKIPISKKFIEW